MKNRENTANPTPHSGGADGDLLPGGALLRGKVVSRNRRQTQSKDGKARFMIALSIMATQGLFVVQRWSDVALPPDLPVVGQQVELPVRVSAYLQAGVPKVRYVWDNADDSHSF